MDDDLAWPDFQRLAKDEEEDGSVPPDVARGRDEPLLVGVVVLVLSSSREWEISEERGWGPAYLIAFEGREMMSGVMGEWFVPRLLTCELRRVKA